MKTAASLIAEDPRRRSARLLPAQHGARPASARSCPRACTSGATSRRSRSTTSSSASARPAPARRTSRWRRRVAFLPREARQPHHPRAAGRRGRREARLPARRPAGEGEPVPASALRRALRHDGRRSASSACSSAASIEIAPLAFMRGRTLNDAFVILDEAQNTTSEQMKMFLTRLGFGSKAVVTGDVTQIDLPPGRVSGLIEALNVVRQIDGHRLHPLRRARRRAPSARAAHRQGVRGSSRPAARSRRPRDRLIADADGRRRPAAARGRGPPARGDGQRRGRATGPRLRGSRPGCGRGPRRARGRRR